MLNVLDVDMTLFRTPYHEIENLFVRRWSPRAMSGEPIENEDLMRLLEAARWAPSSYNEQPWRFIYARRDTPHWQKFFDLLVDGNKSWCDKAAVLFVIVAKKTFTKNGKDNPVAVFDAGAAWQNLALQGTSMHLVVHAMAGFDRDKARSVLNIADDFDVCAMVAVGRPGFANELPESLREMEKPSNRSPVTDISSEGRFSG